MASTMYEEIEQLKEQGRLEEALIVANRLLVKDPKDKEALFQVADIEYRRGEIGRAEKPIDFLLEWATEDAMGYYIKGILEMEKTNRKKARDFFKRSLQLMNEENPEILRCYGLCEYWLGNREDGMDYLQRAYEANTLDAEIILNLIEIAILEEQRAVAKKYIASYQSNKASIQFFDRPASYYDKKIALFSEYIESYLP